MFATLYFPHIAILAASKNGVGLTHRRALFDRIANGEPAKVRHFASMVVDNLEPSERSPYSVQLLADLQLAFGLHADAEELYRRAQKMFRGSARDIRISSSRNAAWQALFHDRLGTALACFSSLSEELGAEPSCVVEARFGGACVLHTMARHHDALHLLRSIEPILADGLVDCPEGWRRLIDALTFDLSTQQQLRSAERLADHAFWQLGAEGSRGTPESAPATQIAEDLGSLGQRLRYLLRMREALDGNRSALLDLAGHLRWASEQGLTGYERSLRLEIAATALALGATPIAENMLEPLHKVESNFTGHRELEYLYCAAKIRQIQSRQIEAQQLYSRYALVAMRNLYEIADVRTSFAKRSTKSAAQSDDISIRLPARYRRAYQHMLDNLSRRDLTVREIAAKIDVSERALQNVFRSCLGLSPAEVLRRKRMEGVRMELFDESEASRKRVKEAAVRWGLSRRSILVNGYSCDADDLQTKCDETQPESRARHGKSAMGSE